VNRSTTLLVIALGLVAYGIYRGLYIPAMLVGRPVPLLLIGFLLQALFGIVAGLGVVLGAPWSPLVIILLGVSAAATVLVEAFVLGIVAYLRAFLEAVVAIIVAVLLAAYVKDRLGTSPPSRAATTRGGLL
jgi:hypothetical protein